MGCTCLAWYIGPGHIVTRLLDIGKDAEAFIRHREFLISYDVSGVGTRRGVSDFYIRRYEK